MKKIQFNDELDFFVKINAIKKKKILTKWEKNGIIEEYEYVRRVIWQSFEE